MAARRPSRACGRSWRRSVSWSKRGAKRKRPRGCATSAALLLTVSTHQRETCSRNATKADSRFRSRQRPYGYRCPRQHALDPQRYPPYVAVDPARLMSAMPGGTADIAGPMLCAKTRRPRMAAHVGPPELLRPTGYIHDGLLYRARTSDCGSCHCRRVKRIAPPDNGSAARSFTGSVARLCVRAAMSRQLSA